MTTTLAIGDRAYSSWSLRGWLLFDAFGLPVQTVSARLYSDALPDLLRSFAPARTVPVMRLDDGTIISESLAIAEELASRHPDAGIWPKAAKSRAVARVLAAEMHAGFMALRRHCPMNLRVSYRDCAPPDGVATDLARLEKIWAWAQAETGASGEWHCGPYCAADAFFAPVAARIAGYNLTVGPKALAYVNAHLGHPSFRRWRAMGMVDGADQDVYRRDWPTRAWPGPSTLPARAVDHGPAVNATCPYSGKVVSHYMETGGRVWGFCNTFCRDMTVADPEAWPAFMKIYRA